MHDRPWYTRSKWHLLALYWPPQALAIHTTTISFIASIDADSLAGWWSEFTSALVSAGALWFSLPWIAGISVCQAALLLPIRPPSLSPPSGRGAILRHAVGGLALSWVAWLTVMWALVVHEIFSSLGADTLFMRLLANPACGPLLLFPAFFAALLAIFRKRTPALPSLVIAATAAGVLLAGALYLLASIVSLAAPDLYESEGEQWMIALPMSISALVGWSVGTPLLWRFCRRRTPEDAVARIASRLFLGTVIETAALIPLDVMVRRRTDCYCAEGTFFTWIVCLSAAFFALGPAVLLGPLSGRRKRWYAGRCEVCAYDMRATPNAARCPECGAGWKAP